MLAYQKSENLGTDVNGGLLQCGFNLTVPADALTTIKTSLAKLVGVDVNKIKLAPINMKNCKLKIYAPSKKGGDYKSVGDGVAVYLAVRHEDSAVLGVHDDGVAQREGRQAQPRLPPRVRRECGRQGRLRGGGAHAD